MSWLGKLLAKAAISALGKSRLARRKEALKKELQNGIDATDSEWVKRRNKAYLDLIDGADNALIEKIEKELGKL